MDQTQLLMIVILIVAIVAGGIIMMDDSCPDSGIRITKSCKCGDEDCPVGNTCNDTDSGKKCTHPTDNPGLERQLGIETDTPQQTGSEVLCQNVDCGDNGSCFQGKCICNPGFSGSRCGLSTMDWTKISQADGGSRVTEIDGKKYCANNYYSDLSVEGGNCELCPSSSLSGDNQRSLAPNNTDLQDCRCENINGKNISYIDSETKECVRCPQDEGSTIENPSKIVPLNVDLAGDETDCQCNNDSGWYNDVNGSGCMRCPSNSTYNQLTENCECITGYEMDNSNNCKIKDNYKQYINKCGIYSYELEDGDKKIVDGLPVLSGLISTDYEDSIKDLLYDDTPNHGTAATWYKHSTSQFSFSDSGVCKYKGLTDQLSTCGEPGSEAQNFDENCNKCKDGKTLVWDSVKGFRCIDDICDSSQGSDPEQNIQKCFADENIIPSADRNFIMNNNLPGNGICVKGDDTNELAGNTCSTQMINISGGDTQGNAMTIPGSDNLRLPNWGDLEEISKPQYSATRYKLNDDNNKIICKINPNIQGLDYEDGTKPKRCLEKNNICERYNKTETGEFQERVCKNNSKCVNINVPPYFDCVDPSKQEPPTNVTTDPDTQYYKDGTYNQCPRNFRTDSGNLQSLTPEQAQQRTAAGQSVVRTYGRLCHLTSATDNTSTGAGICGWGYMKEDENGAIRLKDNEDFIGGTHMTTEGPKPNHVMEQGPSSIFNLPITEDDDNTYAWGRYQCDCSNADNKGKFHRPYTGQTLDPKAYCFGPVNDSSTDIALSSTKDGGKSVHVPWESMYQPRYDYLGNQLPNDANVINNTLLNNKRIDNQDETYDSSRGSPFPNSINNKTWFLNCALLDPSNVQSDGFNTGHFYHFDDAGTGSGDAGDAMGSATCIQCSENSKDNLRGNNQINAHRWLGWNPDNTGISDRSTTFDEYISYLQSNIDKKSDLLGYITSIDLDKPNQLQHQDRICKPAYPNYYGTIKQGTTQAESLGGERAKGTGSLNKRAVLNNFIVRKDEDITTRSDCPLSYEWAPPKFWENSSCDLFETTGNLKQDRSVGGNSHIGLNKTINTSRNLDNCQGLGDWHTLNETNAKGMTDGLDDGNEDSQKKDGTYGHSLSQLTQDACNSGHSSNTFVRNNQGKKVFMESGQPINFNITTTNTSCQHNYTYDDKISWTIRCNGLNQSQFWDNDSLS